VCNVISNVFCTLLTRIYRFLNTCAVLIMSVFGSSPISCLRPAFLKYFPNYFEMVAVAPIITGDTLVRIFSASSLITYLSFKMSTFFNYMFLSLSRIMASGLL